MGTFLMCNGLPKLFTTLIIRPLTLKLPGKGQTALPLNLDDKNIPNADFLLVF